MGYRESDENLARLRRVSDAEIVRTNPVELRAIPEDFWQKVRVAMPMSRQAISMRLDTDVIEWFRGSGPKYQARINAVLRSYLDQVAESVKPVRKRRAV